MVDEMPWGFVKWVPNRSFAAHCNGHTPCLIRSPFSQRPLLNSPPMAQPAPWLQCPLRTLILGTDNMVEEAELLLKLSVFDSWDYVCWSLLLTCLWLIIFSKSIVRVVLRYSYRYLCEWFPRKGFCTWLWRWVHWPWVSAIGPELRMFSHKLAKLQQFVVSTFLKVRRFAGPDHGSRSQCSVARSTIDLCRQLMVHAVLPFPLLTQTSHPACFSLLH